MTREQDRAPLSTEISSPETEVDPQALRRSDNGSRDPDPSKADAAPDERLAIGERLSGRYRIERKLGAGGMGVVYLVIDEQVSGETFAVKVLKECLDAETLSQLREEVRKTRKLSHPNIIDMHSVNVDGTRLYVLMEYLEGKSLDALLAEEFGRGMAFSHAWPIIEDVGAALGYAHDHNVIHSDLKPANVFVANSGRTKLLDFGIARVSHGGLLHKRWGSRALTPAYASCEMLNGEEADRRDDLYSFACVIYEMLSGDRPFGELNALEARDVGTQVPPLAVLSQTQNEALAQALAFDRAGRTAAVESLLSGLRADVAPRAHPTPAVVAGIIAATAAAVGLTYFALDKLWLSRHSVIVQSQTSSAQQAASSDTTSATFNPPPHSIAVLPFVNMSGDKEQEYFSDGLSEELLNDLSRIKELQVAARTSAFSFKGKDANIGTIARELNVGAILEGSVRRSGHTVRITAQLNNAMTGFRLWSQTYDRSVGDVLQLQTEIANAVVSALRVTLLGDEAAKIEEGGTRNAAALDAFLRATRLYWEQTSAKDAHAAVNGYTEAIRLDPEYASAYAARSLASQNIVGNWATSISVIRARQEAAKADARKAITLAPNLSEAHLALAAAYASLLEFRAAIEEFERALALAPGNARVLRDYGRFAVSMGRSNSGINSLRRAVVLDPLNAISYTDLASRLYLLRRYQESLAVTKEGASVTNLPGGLSETIGLFYYYLGDFESARSSCEKKTAFETLAQLCLALTYEKLGRHADAEAMLAKARASVGDAGAYYYAANHAQWGDAPQALKWLDQALRLRDPNLVDLKMDPAFDPVRKEPRFQAIEQALKFPE